MYKVIIISFLLLVGGCLTTQQKQIPLKLPVTTITTSAATNKTIDSLQTSLRKEAALVSALLAKIRQEKTLITFTAEKCHKYALIVKKSPSQSVFIVGWIDRAFLWTKQEYF